MRQPHAGDDDAGAGQQQTGRTGKARGSVGGFGAVRLSVKHREQSRQRGGRNASSAMQKIEAPIAVSISARVAKKMRGERPFVFTNLKSGHGLDQVVAFIEKQGMLRH